MPEEQLPLRRVLGLYPYSNRVAFAVVEHPLRWIDSGSRRVESARDKHFSEIVRDLMEKNRVSVLAVEAEEYNGRGALAMRRVEAAIAIAKLFDIEVVLVHRAMVSLAIGASASASTHAVATLLHERFPELGPRSPRKRRPWETESGRARVFRAVGIALAGAVDGLR